MCSALPRFLVQWLLLLETCAARRTKKSDMINTNHVAFLFTKMCPKGFEPPTHGLEGRCSIQLSYGHTTPRAGLEPATPRLTAACSTIELSRNVLFFSTELIIPHSFYMSSVFLIIFQIFDFFETIKTTDKMYCLYPAILLNSITIPMYTANPWQYTRYHTLSYRQ